jgi:uncharacterized protein (DUF3820 family)
MTMFSFLENRSFFKRECETPDAPTFTATEQKLLTLSLDPAAHEDEIDNAAVMLLRSWRRRGVSAEAIIAGMTQATWLARELSAARGRVMDFGKYKGKTVGEVPPDYLRWALRECSNLSFNLRKAMKLVLQARS